MSLSARMPSPTSSAVRTAHIRGRWWRLFRRGTCRGLNDFVRGMSADYPNLSTDDLRVILVHSRERILPELSESLASYAMQRIMNEALLSD